MKKTNHYLLAGLIFLSPAQHLAHAQGIPVIDVAAIAQAMVQVRSWGEQFKQMEKTILQQQELIKTTTGYRGLANSLNLMPRSALHPNFPVLMAATRESDMATQLAAEQLRSLHSATQTRNTLIQSLMGVAAATNDPKELAEVQARIAVEQAAIANETKEVALVQQSLQLQKEMIYMAHQKKIKESLSSGVR